MTRTKRETSSLTGTVTKQGNGAHIMLPKEWIGIEVKVIPFTYSQTEGTESATKEQNAGSHFEK